MITYVGLTASYYVRLFSSKTFAIPLYTTLFYLQREVQYIFKCDSVNQIQTNRYLSQILKSILRKFKSMVHVLNESSKLIFFGNEFETKEFYSTFYFTWSHSVNPELTGHPLADVLLNKTSSMVCWVSFTAESTRNIWTLLNLCSTPGMNHSLWFLFSLLFDLLIVWSEHFSEDWYSIYVKPSEIFCLLYFI